MFGVNSIAYVPVLVLLKMKKTCNCPRLDRKLSPLSIILPIIIVSKLHAIYAGFYCIWYHARQPHFSAGQLIVIMTSYWGWLLITADRGTFMDNNL